MAGGGRELTIAAQLEVNVDADDVLACVTVFILVDRKGTNVLPALGVVSNNSNRVIH